MKIRESFNLNTEKAGKIKIIIAMFIYGTISICVRNIGLPTMMITFFRSFIGAVFLAVVMMIRKEKFRTDVIKKNLLLLLISGTCLGFNWFALFRAYDYTSVAVSTLCYYMAPTLIILASPFVLKESLGRKKLICALVALAGMILVSGIVKTGVSNIAELKGIAIGLLAAVLYATIILVNKQMKGLSAYERTLMQLLVSAIVQLPICLFTLDFSGLAFAPSTVIWLLVAGIVYTGIPYTLYFGSLEIVSAQTSAILSYIDPIVAVLISVFFFAEGISIPEIVGAVLILGAAFVSEN